MSLTRDEWEMTWRDLKRIETALRKAPPSQEVDKAQDAIDRIKVRVQSVIGQLE